jgi:hypothetical protein
MSGLRYLPPSEIEKSGLTSQIQSEGQPLSSTTKFSPEPEIQFKRAGGESTSVSASSSFRARRAS